MTKTYKIKPLEFKHIGNDIYKAESVAGTYCIYKVTEYGKDKFYCYHIDISIHMLCDSIEHGELLNNEHFELFMRKGLIKI